MTSDQDQPTPASGGVDPLDETQPVDVPRFTPAPDPRPDTRWAWANPEPRPADGWAASPEAATAASSLGASAPRSWSSPASSASASWGSAQASGTPAWATPRPASPNGGTTPGAASVGAMAIPGGAGNAASVQRRSGPGVGTVAAVALLSAVLASTGTVLALSASGTFNVPATTGQVPTGGTPGGVPGTGTAPLTDDSAAVITSSSRVSPSVVKITSNASTVDPSSGNQTDGVGSGIIYDAGGWILTNHHVVAGAGEIKVETKDGKSYTGTVYGTDTLTDLAIVKVEATGLPAASLGSSDGLKVGQLVVAVGSPLGTYSFSVTSGIVSGKGRSVIISDGSTISNLIQTDAAINPGNSGGPLADANGNVVGINTLSADNSSGIGFAIPIDIAKPIMNQAVKGEKLERPWIGIRYEAIDQKVKEAEKLSVDSGALVISSASGESAIQPNSPAAAAGLKDGDIVLSINGIAIDQEHPLNLLLIQFAPKDTIQLEVLRDGKTMTIPVTLGVRPANLR